jgi:hypothetical protein
VFEFLGYGMEAFVFGYLGLTFFSYANFKISPDLFLIELAIILIGRFAGVFLTIGIFSLCCGWKHGISLKELVFIWYAGMIRGAIAFGLVLRIDKKFKNRDVIVTTSLALVIFTTIVFGSTVSLLSKCLFGGDEKDVEIIIDEDQLMRDDSQISPEQTPEKRVEITPESPTPNLNESEDKLNSQNLETLAPDDEQFHLSNLSGSSAGHHIHPNEMKQSMQIKFKATGLTKFLLRFDRFIMKPIFVYKYERKNAEQSDKLI